MPKAIVLVMQAAAARLAVPEVEGDGRTLKLTLVCRCAGWITDMCVRLRLGFVLMAIAERQGLRRFPLF
jgi:hypothetical protein